MTIGQNRDVKPARFAQKWKGLSQMKKKKNPRDWQTRDRGKIKDLKKKRCEKELHGDGEGDLGLMESVSQLREPPAQPQGEG